MRDAADYVAGFGLIVIVALSIWAAVVGEREANRNCEEMIARAKTNSDSLIVYGMKPYSKYSTCYDRLN